MTHTPGPWRLARRGNGRGELPIIGPNGEIGCLRGAGSLDDGHLLAAAPELLEALEDAEFLLRKAAINPREIVSMLDSLNRSAVQARAAIAKARGN